MKEQIINTEIARLAKEKGFNTPTMEFTDKYDEEASVMDYIGDSFEEKLEYAIDHVKYWRPTQSLLAKWLREVHKIHIEIFRRSTGYGFTYKLFDIKTFNSPQIKIGALNYEWTYEQALEFGLQEVLKMIK